MSLTAHLCIFPTSTMYMLPVSFHHIKLNNKNVFYYITGVSNTIL